MCSTVGFNRGRMAPPKFKAFVYIKQAVVRRVVARKVYNLSRLSSVIKSFQFNVVQNIPKLRATSFHLFKILSDLFLVVTNNNDDTTRSLTV